MVKSAQLSACLIGTAIGDSMGLPYEGLSARRRERLFGAAIDRQRLVLGRGMASDDTEHSCMVAQALFASGGDVDKFSRSLAWRLRFWFLGLPAGIGKATLFSIIKLWLGFPPSRSGVYSAGNGPAMRSAIIGVLYFDEPEKMRALVRACTRLTHTDPKAEAGALAVAVAAGCAARGTEFFAAWNAIERPNAPEFNAAMDAMRASIERGESTRDFARAQGLECGVTGYVLHTVPVAIHAWLAHRGDFAAAIRAIITCGGDTDTTAAITGAIAGTETGIDGIPAAWRAGYVDAPRTLAWITRLGERLNEMKQTGKRLDPLPLAWWAIPLRNAMFLIIVLAHGVRRMLPPY